jgi:hypothetical protein
MTTPAKIWLQVGEGDGELPELWVNDEVTWCSDRVDDSDVGYIRADVVGRVIRFINAAEAVDGAKEFSTSWEGEEAAFETAKAALTDEDRALLREYGDRRYM